MHGCVCVFVKPSLKTVRLQSRTQGRKLKAQEDRAVAGPSGKHQGGKTAALMALASAPMKSSGAIPELRRGSRAVLLPAAKQHPRRLLQSLKREKWLCGSIAGFLIML